MYVANIVVMLFVYFFTWFCQQSSQCSIGSVRGAFGRYMTNFMFVELMFVCCRDKTDEYVS